uniref:Uncharacterized protein n=1 Tax=Picea sitchensis TaxID=3332 RepID=D5ACG4_PICSI|nr:unknown [Picea sitchensis]
MPPTLPCSSSPKALPWLNSRRTSTRNRDECGRISEGMWVIWAAMSTCSLRLGVGSRASAVSLEDLENTQSGGYEAHCIYPSTCFLSVNICIFQKEK